jgi:hypothetical protein
MSLTEKIDENTVRSYLEADAEIKHMEELAKSQIKDLNFLDGILNNLESEMQELEKEEIMINKNSNEYNKNGSNNPKEDNESIVPNKILRNFNKWEKYMKVYKEDIKQEAINNMKEMHDNIQNRKYFDVLFHKKFIFKLIFYFHNS